MAEKRKPKDDEASSVKIGYVSQECAQFLALFTAVQQIPPSSVIHLRERRNQIRRNFLLGKRQGRGLMLREKDPLSSGLNWTRELDRARSGLHKMTLTLENEEIHAVLELRAMPALLSVLLRETNRRTTDPSQRDAITKTKLLRSVQTFRSRHAQDEFPMHCIELNSIQSTSQAVPLS